MHISTDDDGAARQCRDLTLATCSVIVRRRSSSSVRLPCVVRASSVRRLPVVSSFLTLEGSSGFNEKWMDRWVKIEIKT